MNKSGVKTKVILFLGIGVALIALLLVLFTKTTTLFYPSYEIRMRTSHVGELVPGNGVFLSGIKIGDVVGLELEPDLKHAIVKMRILGQYKIGKNARFAIHQQGFLGQYYVEVMSTGETKEFLKDGDLVQSDDTIDFIQAGKLSYGLIARIKETLKRVEMTLEKSRNIFNSNIFSQVDLVANNFGNAIGKSTSIVFTVESLVESNSPTIDKFSSDIELINSDWQNLRLKFTQFTNYLVALNERIEPDLGNISSNSTVIKHSLSKLLGKTNKIRGDESEVSGTANFMDRVLKILYTTERLNEFSSNLNAVGMIKSLRNIEKKTDNKEKDR